MSLFFHGLLLHCLEILLCRKRLFNMINELPTIFEIVTGTAKKQVKEKSTVNHGSNKSKSNTKVVKRTSLMHNFFCFLENWLVVQFCQLFFCALLHKGNYHNCLFIWSLFIISCDHLSVVACTCAAYWNLEYVCDLEDFLPIYQ